MNESIREKRKGKCGMSFMLNLIVKPTPEEKNIKVCCTEFVDLPVSVG